RSRRIAHEPASAAWARWRAAWRARSRPGERRASGSDEWSWVVLLFCRRNERRQAGNEIDRPADVAGGEPCGEKVFAAVLGDELRDQRLVGFGGCGAERESDFGEA